MAPWVNIHGMMGWSNGILAFSAGVWLGVDKRTGQYLVYDKDMGGIRQARTLIPMPRPQKWSAETVQSVAGLLDQS